MECPENSRAAHAPSPARAIARLINRRMEDVARGPSESRLKWSARKTGPFVIPAALSQRPNSCEVPGERYATRPSPLRSVLVRGMSTRDIPLLSRPTCSTHMAASSEPRHKVSYPTLTNAASRRPARLEEQAATSLARIVFVRPRTCLGRLVCLRATRRIAKRTAKWAVGHLSSRIRCANAIA
jgi:hypothetical protein